MVPSTFLITLLLWLVLPNGQWKPASRALLSCEGIAVFGSDDGANAVGPISMADSKGTVIIEAPQGVYSCRAWTKDYSFQFDGDIEVTKDHEQINIPLRP